MQPIRFIVIGCGQVFTKYWIRAHHKGEIYVSGIICKDTPLQDTGQFSDIPFFQTKSNEDTINILLEKSADYDAIALLVPADIRLALIKLILSDDGVGDKKIFIEKPFTRDVEALEEYTDLIDKHSSRLHFASKYAAGRADILLNAMERRTDYPLLINSVMIEGSKYFSKVNHLAESNLYIKDGPELDIGFHMLNIASTFLNLRSDKIREISITDDTVMDLNRIRPYFLPYYGFVAEVLFTLESGIIIPMYLQVGKADCMSERHIDFDFHDCRYIQEFTTLTAQDPVYVIEEDTRTKLTEHSQDYLYYSKELLPEWFCKQSKKDQLISIALNRVCLKIKHIRESKYTESISTLSK